MSDRPDSPEPKPVPPQSDVERALAEMIRATTPQPRPPRPHDDDRDVDERGRDLPP